MALTKEDHLALDISSKPNVNSEGYIAVNYKGNWRFICVNEWKFNTSDTICGYLGFVSSDNHELVGNNAYPHLRLGELEVGHPETSMYNRFKRQVSSIVFFSLALLYVLHISAFSIFRLRKLSGLTLL